MERQLFDAAATSLLVKVAWYVVTAIVTGVGATIGTLLWGRGGRKRLVEDNKRLNNRVAALETRASMPAINQLVNFTVGASAQDNERQLRNAVEAKTSQNLKETIRRLPKKPLGDGHSYARLPDGTNIVTVADGTIRLAIPKPLSATASAGPISASATLLKRPASMEEEP